MNHTCYLKTSSHALFPLACFTVGHTLICQPPPLPKWFAELSTWSRQMTMNVEFRWTATFFWALPLYPCRPKWQQFFFLPFFGLLGAQICGASHGLTVALYFQHLGLFLCGHLNSQLSPFLLHCGWCVPCGGRPLHLVWWILFNTNNLHHLKNTLDVSLSD